MSETEHNQRPSVRQIACGVPASTLHILDRWIKVSVIRSDDCLAMRGVDAVKRRTALVCCVGTACAIVVHRHGFAVGLIVLIGRLEENKVSIGRDLDAIVEFAIPRHVEAKLESRMQL